MTAVVVMTDGENVCEWRVSTAACAAGVGVSPGDERLAQHLAGNQLGAIDRTRFRRTHARLRDDVTAH